MAFLLFVTGTSVDWCWDELFWLYECKHVKVSMCDLSMMNDLKPHGTVYIHSK